MKLWGPPSVIERREEAGELIFLIQPQRYFIHVIFISAFAGFFLGNLLGLWVGIGVALVAAVAAYYWTRTPADSLTLIANEHTIGVYSSNRSMSYRWADIFKLSYIGGGEDNPSGLGVSISRWKSQVLVNCVNRDQGEEIIAVINQRFPSLPYAAEPPGILDSIFHQKKDDPHSELAPPDNRPS